MSSDRAFLRFDVETELPQPGQEFFGEDHVFFEGRRVERNIINIDVESFSNHVSKYFVHGSLEGGWGIGRSKGHPEEFVMSIWGDKSRFGNGISPHTNLVISHEHVVDGKEVHFWGHIFQYIVDSRDWEGIMLGDGVELAVIHTHSWGESSFSILLWDYDDGGTPGAALRSDDSRFQHLLDFFTNPLFVVRCQSVGSLFDWFV